MLLDFQFYSDISKAGKMDSGRIWRYRAVEDKHVFLKRGSAEVGGLTVDILLDASASQINRQETISTQAYIIAESLTNCGIPVRVYSFCTKMQFTVITLFRNYDETNNNQKIFNYIATGCNRDGLAIKTAVRMIEETDDEHKLLIVLSDAKPLDTQIINDDSRLLAEHDYTDTPAVLDTAVEVRKGRNQGISVLCVFTGLDEDLPAARKIYGNNFVRIKSPDRFADMVGLLIQNELKNL